MNKKHAKYFFPDPINEAIWWQKKYIQNTKLFPQYNFIEQKGNFGKIFDYDSQNGNPIKRRDFPRQGYFGRTRFPENQWDPEDEPFRRTYDWPPDYSFQHRQEIKSYSSSSSANEIYRTRKLIESRENAKRVLNMQSSSSGGDLGVPKTNSLRKPGNPGTNSLGTPNLQSSSSGGGLGTSKTNSLRRPGTSGTNSLVTPNSFQNSSLGGNSGNSGTNSLGTPRAIHFPNTMLNPLSNTMTQIPVPNYMYKNLNVNGPNTSMPHSVNRPNAYVYQIPVLRSVSQRFNFFGFRVFGQNFRIFGQTFSDF